MSIVTTNIPSLFSFNSPHSLQPFCTAATTLSQHQPPSENPRFSHKRGGSRRPIFATCARDQTSSQLPPCRRTGAIGPYRNRSRGPLVTCQLWRRAALAVAEPEPAAAPPRRGIRVCRSVSRVFEEQRKRGELVPACMQLAASLPAQDAYSVPIKPHIISPISKTPTTEFPNHCPLFLNPVTGSQPQGKARQSFDYAARSRLSPLIINGSR